MMGYLISKRFTKSPVDWEIRRMYDLSLQLMAAHVGLGDTKGAAYVSAILNRDAMTDPGVDRQQVIQSLVGFLPDSQVTHQMRRR